MVHCAEVDDEVELVARTNEEEKRVREVAAVGET
jgi:hypothetical protein